MIFVFLLVVGLISCRNLEVTVAENGNQHGWVVSVGIKNVETSSLYLLKWKNVLFDHIPKTIFNIKDENGDDVDFIGSVGKFLPPSYTHSVLAIRPEERIELEIDLSNSFKFYPNKQYEVSFSDIIMTFNPYECGKNETDLEYCILQKGSENHVSDSYSFQTGDNEESILPWEKRNLNQRRYDIKDCTQKVKSETVQAMENANTGVENNIEYLKTYCESGDSSGYTRWFGTVQQTRWDSVKNDFTKIKEYINDITIRCNDPDCTPYTYAFVYPSDPDMNVYVCGIYEEAPVDLEPESQPGIIIHEVSHFEWVAATDDYEYGVRACERLAKNKPNKAIKNADSLEYFSEFPRDSCY